MKLKFTALLIVSLSVFSCVKKEAPVVEVKNNTIDSLDMVKFADSLNLRESQYTDLIDSINTLQTKSDLFYRKIHIQDKEISQLSSQLRLLEKENQVLKGKNKKPKISKAERSLQNMVFKMHEAWIQLTKEKDTEVLMKYFNPHFLISRIAINADDTANVSQFSHDDFGKYLETNILDKDGISIEFDDVEFLDIQTRNNTYFNVAYRCSMGTYKNDKLLETSATLVTITGKNIEGEWGISSYSWVSFKEGMD